MDDLTKAVEAFDAILSTPEKWTQGKFFRNALGNGCSKLESVRSSCLMGALNLATITVTDLPTAPDWMQRPQVCPVPVYAALRRHLYEAVVEYYGCPECQYEHDFLIVQFNDRAHTRFADIRAVIELMRAHLAVEAVDAVETAEVPVLEDA